ncbi:BBE domain-containing protein [Nannocystis sp. ILAH1]|uniref:BBE domain-containing protein n=1 Tax=Nannocystis sp. ILAH1 TaxID=2996789 RepID=UPI00226FEF74|nr:BBE domain-containing protein [Nannocystis sp. ILAH1]MCY0989541.1 BBE domain-containing protein [Nannocystis sp. ILAH1]
MASLQYQVYWTTPNQAQTSMAWVEGFRRAMLPWQTGGAYLNYCDTDIEDWPQAYYGENFPRLVKVKRQWDPENLFHFAQSIPV